LDFSIVWPTMPATLFSDYHNPAVMRESRKKTKAFANPTSPAVKETKTRWWSRMNRGEEFIRGRLPDLISSRIFFVQLCPASCY
jgi:hypothetical protein